MNLKAKIKQWEKLASKVGWRKITGIVVCLESDEREWLDKLIPKGTPNKGKYLITKARWLSDIINSDDMYWDCTEKQWLALEKLECCGPRTVWFTRSDETCIRDGSKVIVFQPGDQ
jgi:hypothetical protein